MKKSCTSTNVKRLVLALVVLALPGQSRAAKPVAFVEAAKGEAFVMIDGKTSALKRGDAIPDLGEVMVEDAGQVHLMGANKVNYHLDGGGQLKFMNKMVELKRGHLWFQSAGGTGAGKGPFEVQTANAQLTYWTGEGIVSYDPGQARTQFLSINGGMEFGNLMEKHMMVVVDTGFFSFIDNVEEEGMPRRPTQIGRKSYDQFTALFDGVLPMAHSQVASALAAPAASGTSMLQMVPVTDGETDVVNQALEGRKAPAAAPRAPASVRAKTPAAAPSESPGTTVVRKMPEEVNLQGFDADGFHREKLEVIKRQKAVKKPWARESAYGKKAQVEVRIFGMPSARTSAPTAKADTTARVPASIPVTPAAAPKAKLPDAGADVFESQLLDQYKKQMRHSQEVNSLINELQTYKQDYQTDY